MDREISIIHSFCTCTVYCTQTYILQNSGTVLLVLRTQVAFLHRDQRYIFLCVVKFASSTRLAKFAQIKTLRNIWRIQYSARRTSMWIHCDAYIVCCNYKPNFFQYAVKAQTSLAPLSWFHGSRVTTAHVQQCCIFQSYAKTVPSRMKLTRWNWLCVNLHPWQRHVITACDVWL